MPSQTDERRRQEISSLQKLLAEKIEQLSNLEREYHQLCVKRETLRKLLECQQELLQLFCDSHPWGGLLIEKPIPSELPWGQNHLGTMQASSIPHPNAYMAFSLADTRSTWRAIIQEVGSLNISKGMLVCQGPTSEGVTMLVNKVVDHYPLLARYNPYVAGKLALMNIETGGMESPSQTFEAELMQFLLDCVSSETVEQISEVGRRRRACLDKLSVRQQEITVKLQAMDSGCGTGLSLQASMDRQALLMKLCRSLRQDYVSAVTTSNFLMHVIPPPLLAKVWVKGYPFIPNLAKFATLCASMTSGTNVSSEEPRD